MYMYSVCEFEFWVPGSQVIGSTECGMHPSQQSLYVCSYSVRATNMSLPAFSIRLDLPWSSCLIWQYVCWQKRQHHSSCL